MWMRWERGNVDDDAVKKRKKRGRQKKVMKTATLKVCLPLS
jgi:hypothetical protein